MIPKNMSHYIHDDRHLTQFTSCLDIWCGEGAGSDKFVYENVRWVPYLTPLPPQNGRIRTHSFGACWSLHQICELFRNPLIYYYVHLNQKCLICYSVTVTDGRGKNQFSLKQYQQFSLEVLLPLLNFESFCLKNWLPYGPAPLLKISGNRTYASCLKETKAGINTFPRPHIFL